VSERQPSKPTYERLLRCALSEFGQKGFEGARLENVARAANVTKQLLYHYFKTKDQLYELVLDRLSEEMLDLVDDERYDTLPPADALGLLVERIINAFSQRSYLTSLDLDQGLLHGRHIHRRSTYLPTVQRFVSDRLAPVLRRGQSSGEFGRTMDPLTFYWMVMSLTTVVFKNRWEMSETMATDFSSNEALKKWEGEVTQFIVAALR
jgi:AcrR family transcriptional regulator